MKTFLGVKIALLPFVLFWTLSGFGHPLAGAAAGALWAAGATLARIRAAQTPWLELAGAVALSAIALGLALSPETRLFSLDPHGLALSFVALALACAVSVLRGSPWTATYARTAYEGMSHSALFMRVNTVLSSAWAAIFAWVGLAHLAQWPGVLAWLPVVIGAVGSIVMPRVLVARSLRATIAARGGAHWVAPTFALAPGTGIAPNADVDTDVVIVGAGLGGLTAAALLAQAGVRVIVIEQHDVPGGFAHTWLRKGRDGDARPVFRFDSGVHDVSGWWDGGPVHGVFRQLGLEHRLAWRRLERREIGPQGARDVPLAWDAYVNDLAAHFPGAGDGVRTAMREIASIYASMYSMAATNAGIPGAPDTVDGMIAWARAHPLAVRWMERPFAEFLSTHLSDRDAIDAIRALSGYITADVESLTVAQMVPLFGYHLHGGFYPAGGSGQMAAALVEAIEQHGGQVRLKTAVTRVRVEAGEVRGVELAGGEAIRAPAVVMNADFLHAATSLIDPVHWPHTWREALRAARPACSAFMVHLGVRGEFPDARPLTRVTTAQGGVEVVVPSRVDDSAAPRGYSTVELIRLVPHERAATWFEMQDGNKESADNPRLRASHDYSARKSSIGDEMIALAEQALPGLTERIVVRCEASPVTFRRYAGSSSGSIYGCDAPAAVRATKSPIRGLVFAGAITHGPGVEAVVISGALAAKALVG